MAQQKIRIRLKAYDHQQLDRSAAQIVDTAQRSGATVTGPVPLPTENNRYTVLRGPFKDKDSREHFEVRTHKRGMTQVFDQETGSLTPVTVIEAGPCPVVSVRMADTDGYDAVQLAFDAVPERKLQKARIGHLKKNGVEPHRKLVEIRGPHELTEGETVTVETFEPGEKVKVSGVSIGKGFQGTVKRHNFSRG